jgi:hypothetical protein
VYFLSDGSALPSVLIIVDGVSITKSRTSMIIDG